MSGGDENDKTKEEHHYPDHQPDHHTGVERENSDSSVGSDVSSVGGPPYHIHTRLRLRFQYHILPYSLLPHRVHLRLVSLVPVRRVV